MRRTTMLLVGVVTLGIASGCNAVFGLEDKSYGAGGAGGAGSSTGDASTSTGVASSSSGEGGEGGDGTGGSCEPVEADLTVVGDFGPGWEAFWSLDNVTAVEEDGGGQPIVHVIVVDAEAGASFTNTLDGDAVCAEACVQVKFSLWVNAALFLNVVVEDDENGESLRMSVLSESRSTSTWDTVETEWCQLDPRTVSPDRLAFILSEGGGDFLLDDVVLTVDTCPGPVDRCNVF